MFLFSIRIVDIIYFLYSYIVNLFHRRGNYKKLAPPNELEIYTEKRKTPFIKLMEKVASYNEDELRELNSNIEPLFYSKEEYTAFLKEEITPIELLWKSRILMESTPRGNIIMFYNTYKMGFSYYCDSNGIPYSILNMVAMRYVTIYKCLDFFVDNEFTVRESPLIKIHMDKPREKKEINDNDKKQNLIISNTNAPFAKFKNYKKSNQNQEQNQTKTKQENISNKEFQFHRNTFISMGKTSNFSILQTVDKKKKKIRKILFNENDTIYKDVFDEPNHGEKKLSYLEYKQKQGSHIR